MPGDPRYDKHYAPQIPRYMGAMGDPRVVNAVVAVSNINEARLSRANAPRSGVVRKLLIYVGTQSGNIDVGFYDTAATRAKLVSTGSMACPAAGWREIAVTATAVQQGVSYEMSLACDNTTATFGHFNGAQVGQLPTGWWPVQGGAAPKTNPRILSSFPLPATMAEASLVQDSGRVFIVGALVESS
jgi:hypothetical protein